MSRTREHDAAADILSAPRVVADLTSAPRFVVVGHPNKGKSSIVATLAQDASVAIADESGTTRTSAMYPMKVDGRVLYVLVDTPGFQRPAAVLADLQARAASAGMRPAAVSAFLQQYTGSGRFPDECELLRPIADEAGAGAGVLYVVDGSVPYGPEYEAEMEVLRWSGRPRMALINLIGERDDHVDEWRNALGQYFSVVRVFNAVTAEFDKQLELLRAFGQLHDPWRGIMNEAVQALSARRKRQQDSATAAVARMLADAVTHVETCRIAIDEAPDAAKSRLLERYRNSLREMERKSRDAVERAYGHPALERDEPALTVLDSDLFSDQTERLFGLTRMQAVQMGAAGGAGFGLLLDVAASGLSLGMATVAGGVAGAGAAWFGFDRLARVEVLDMHALGAKEVRVGPLDNVSVRHAMTARALAHHALVASRTHAARDRLSVALEAGEAPGDLNLLSVQDSRTLDKHFKALARAEQDERALAEAEDGLRDALSVLIEHEASSSG